MESITEKEAVHHPGTDEEEQAAAAAVETSSSSSNMDYLANEGDTTQEVTRLPYMDELRLAQFA